MLIKINLKSKDMDTEWTTRRKWKSWGRKQHIAPTNTVVKVKSIPGKINVTSAHLDHG